MEDSNVFFKPTSVVPISTKDILSWIFDEDTYSQEEPIYIDAEDPNHSLNRRECKSIVRRLIAGFRTLPLQRGDCVCVHSFNNLYYSCVFLAVVGAGLVWAGTNPGYTQHELVHHLKTAKAKLIIVEPDLLADITPAASSCGITENSILIFDWSKHSKTFQGGTSSRPKSWEILMNQGEQDWYRFEDEKTQRSITACRLFSSGTTGLPKAASISHQNLVAQHTLFHEQVKKPYKIKRILCLPFFHAAMVPIGHIAPLRSGHVSHVMRRFQLEEFMQCTERNAVTEIFVVPPILVSIVQSHLVKKYSLRSLKWGMIGGAPISLEYIRRFAKLMSPHGHVNPIYGMTELTCIGCAYPWPEQDTDGSIGYWLPNLEIKLVDDTGKEVKAYDTPGEILIRGPTVIDSYLDNPEANARSFTDGWFHTGDIGYCAAKTRKWYIVDRKKELIKVRGFQVVPPELEAVLMSHPLILDAAIIGVPASNDVDGEAPRAYIVRKPGPEAEDLKENEVKQYVAKRLAKYKQLNGGVVFVDNLPKTASGKYLKKDLRAQYHRERGIMSKL